AISIIAKARNGCIASPALRPETLLPKVPPGKSMTPVSFPLARHARCFIPIRAFLSIGSKSICKARATLSDNLFFSDAFDSQRVLAQEGFALCPCENPGRGADGAHATGTQGTGDTQTVLGIQAVEQTGNIAGIEG